MALPDAEELYAAALRLPAAQRERLAQELLDSLDDDQSLSPEEWEAAWNDEIERRVRDIREGTAELVDGEQVFREARTRVRALRK